MSLIPTKDVDALLASLLSDFGKAPPKGKKSAPKGKKPPPSPLPQHTAFNLSKTGYREWKATARIIQIEDQICHCCGTSTPSVKGEFYELENSLAHSVWYRPEGYGIQAQEELPIKFIDLEPKYVTACAHCRLEELDQGILAQVIAHRQLSFPF